uniref:peptidylprolyl isomerase n=1 Tax=Ditylum brightwellii TaxID=49249 RepID=A0A6V2NVN0_9STRA|mmetsp:Transcript_8597/g.12663  ORF Transcript_8597/g.12663 Transcript_8597/m.12663 type:complete len:203 (-) Transcript_8597:122-730(-)
MVAAMMKGVAMMLMSSMMTSVESYSMISMKSSSSAIKNGDAFQNRRSFLSSAAAVGAAFGVSAVVQPEAALAGPQIVTTNTGIKYAVTKELQKGSKAIVPQKGDFVVVEYTGYLANGQIFDATHAEGKKEALLFKLGSNAVIPGLDDMVSRMAVGEKVQAIIPPELAYGEKGVCLESGECLIKPGATLVFDILLKKTSIPPP